MVLRRISTQWGGTPGADRFSPPAAVENLAINELPAATDVKFFVEISNDGDSPLPLAGYEIASSAVSGLNGYVFPTQTINPGEYIQVTEAELGFAASDGDAIFLYTMGQQNLVDARRVTGRLRGRSQQRDDRWLYPNDATPGVANTFDFNDDIVINEIFYHPFGQVPAGIDVSDLDRRVTKTLVGSALRDVQSSASGLPGLGLGQIRQLSRTSGLA